MYGMRGASHPSPPEKGLRVKVQGGNACDSPFFKASSLKIIGLLNLIVRVLSRFLKNVKRNVENNFVFDK